MLSSRCTGSSRVSRSPAPGRPALVEARRLCDTRAGKRGAIHEDEPGILERMDIAGTDWVHMTQNFENDFGGLVGSVGHLRSKIQHFWKKSKERRRIHALKACRLRLG